MKGRTRWRRSALALVAGSLAVAVAAPPDARATDPDTRLSIFDGFAASQTVYIQPRANSVFALPADQLIGATHAEINSQPRAQGYAATWGVPLAQNLRGVGIPVDYYGQCYANYPGEAAVDCGVPVKDPAPPKAPEGAPGGGGAFNAHAEAGGDDVEPEQTRALGRTEAGGLFIEGALRVAYNHSTSESFIEDAVVHAVTHSVAQGISVGDALRIGSVEAVAEATHAGDEATATGNARTEMQNMTIAGVPVTMGPEGVLVQGQPLGEAPTPMAEPILEAMAAEGMTIEPLPAPTVSRDTATGLVEAKSVGFRVQLLSPDGDGKFEVVFGRALARAGAVRSADDVPFEIPVGEDAVPITSEAAAPSGPAEITTPPIVAATSSPAATSPPATPSGGFSEFDAVFGSVSPIGDSVASNVVDEEPTVAPTATEPVAIPPRTTGRTELAALPSELEDVSSRVFLAYAAVAGIVTVGVAWALRFRGRRFEVNA